MSVRVLAMVTNIPGPLAAAQLARDGCNVSKIEPPAGDPLNAAAPAWYAQLSAGLRICRLNLRADHAATTLTELLEEADLLLTAMRPAALDRLGLSWPQLHERYPRLVHVAIVGEAPPHADRAGHDLTFQAAAGLVRPPMMPLSAFADLHAAQAAVAAAYRGLYERERSGSASRYEVAIARSAAQLAQPLHYGLTRADGPLGGALAVYRCYETADGWIALAALETHFQQRLRAALQIEVLDVETLSARFSQHPCAYWENLAQMHDLPLCALADA